MAFLDDLNSLLGGPSAQPAPAVAAGGMTNYGAMPSANPSVAPGGASASPAGQVLARLRTQMQAAPQSNSNPNNISQPLLGGNLGAALSGLAEVDPTRSKFGAFAQGLSGGITAQQRALYANAQLGLQQQNSAVDAYSKLTGADVENRRQALAERQFQMNQNGMAGIRALLGGNPQAAPPAAAGGAPMPLQGALAPAPMQQPQPASPAAATKPQVAAPPLMPGPGQSLPPPAGAPPMAAPAAMPPSTPASASRLDPESDPHYLEQRAATLDQGSMLAFGFNPALGSKLGNDANQIRQKAQQIRATGIGTATDGSQIVLPGYTDAKGEIASSEAASRKAGENSQAEQSSPSGAKYLPPPPGFKSAPAGPAPLDPPPGATIGNTPPSLQIDPKTAAVSTSIPAAPVGGGYPVPDIPPGAKLTKPGDAATEQAKTDAQNFSNLTGQLPAIDEGLQRYQTLANAFKQFPTGPGQSHLTTYAAIAQAYGHPELASVILGGDAAASQAATKEAVNLTLNTLKAANPRFAQSEFSAVANKGTPNPDMLPQANHQLIAEGMGTMLRNKAFIGDWQQAQQNGWQSPSAFYTKWSQANPLSGFVNSAQQQIGNLKGMSLPGASDWKVGVTYVAPNDMTPQQQAAFQKRGIAAGQGFKFTGAGLQPVSAGTAFAGGQ